MVCFHTARHEYTAFLWLIKHRFRVIREFSQSRLFYNVFYLFTDLAKTLSASEVLILHPNVGGKRYVFLLI